jgi:DNA polymerase-4
VIVPPRFDRYQAASRTIMSVFGDFSPDVEALSLDEAFLDMTGSEKLFGEPEAIGRRLKDAIQEATGGLTASVGLSATKYVAKVASAYRKPNGLTVVAPGDAKAWLAPFPVSRLWGAGPKNQARLHNIGLHTIGDVAHADPVFLSEQLGKVGTHFYALAQARDPRPIIGSRESKSIGSECTLDKDVREKVDIKIHLRRAADRIGSRLRRKGYVAFGVGIKLKTASFQILTRRRQIKEPTDVAETIYSVGLQLLELIDHPGPFRLIGMVAYDPVGIDDLSQADLFSSRPQQRLLEAAIDALADRFGANVVHRANDLTASPRNIAPTLDFLDD